VSGSGLPPTTESVENLLRSLGDLDLGEDADNELGGLLERMMTQLLNKDVLYDPLRELADGVRIYFSRTLFQFKKIP
jgi:peroxin-19